MDAREAGAAGPTAATSAYTTTRRRDFWVLLRAVLGVQGAYYLITGGWLLLDRVVAVPGPFSPLRLAERAFGPDLVAALSALIGLVLLIAASRPRPDGLFTGLGLGSAVAFLAVGWRYRGTFSNWVYLELLAEVLLALALFVAFWAAVIDDRRRR